jgi:hypothetical protein
MTFEKAEVKEKITPYLSQIIKKTEQLLLQSFFLEFLAKNVPGPTFSSLIRIISPCSNFQLKHSNA